MPTPQLQTTLLKVLLPLVVIGAVFVAARRRHLTPHADLALARPPVGQTVLWIVIYATWMLITNRIVGWRGPWDFTPWMRDPLLVDVLRVLAVGILGPVAEELLFRGLFYRLLVPTRLGVAGTIVVLAIVWSVLHYTYSPVVIGILLVDGLLLGTARYTTASMYVPIAMHIVWNLYAVW